MDNNNNLYHGADCDPADCNYRTPNTEEIASDFVIETETMPVKEFTPAPEEYVYGSSPEVSNSTTDEVDPQSEQAATYDVNNFDGAYETETDMYETETSEEYIPYDTEAGEDMTDVDEYDRINDDVDYNVTEDYDPGDETAATIDEWYTVDKPSARERCELDDYEIISDVLGAEKQIVKLYSTALCEAAEEPFRNLIRENLDEAAADQYKAFEFMQKRGMYKTEQATEEKITEAKQQFTPLCKNNCCHAESTCCNDDGCKI